jgi:hypothetical protein
MEPARGLGHATGFPAVAADLKNVDIRPMLEAACSGKAYFGRGKDGQENGCSTSPPRSGDPGPGEVSLQAVTFGHFISATSDDAILSTLGCEPHSFYFGGSFLLTKRTGTWQLLGYHSRVITEKCHTLNTKSGRQMLVCSHYFGGQGAASRLTMGQESRLESRRETCRIESLGA